MKRQDIRKIGVSLRFVTHFIARFRVASVVLLGSWLGGLASEGEAQELKLQPVTDLRTRTDGEDWPHFLGPRGDGTSLETGIRKDW